MRCWYGVAPAEVGPFCETCYATIKAHEEPYDRRHPAVPVAVLRALITDWRLVGQDLAADDLTNLCDEVSRT